MILYMSGHSAHIWSVIEKDGETFRALSGRVNAYGENIVTESTKSNMFDTVALFSKYRELLLWGLDSLPSEARRMKPIRSDVYKPFYHSLSVIPLNTPSYFDSDTDARFAGPDSIVFNSKFKSLSQFMYWLAEPFIRPYTPDSIYIR